MKEYKLLRADGTPIGFTLTTTGNAGVLHPSLRFVRGKGTAEQYTISKNFITINELKNCFVTLVNRFCDDHPDICNAEREILLESWKAFLRRYGGKAVGMIKRSGKLSRDKQSPYLKRDGLPRWLYFEKTARASDSRVSFYRRHQGKVLRKAIVVTSTTDLFNAFNDIVNHMCAELNVPKDERLRIKASYPLYLEKYKEKIAEALTS